MYTTKQRNKIYKKALENYIEYDCSQMGLGLCYAISSFHKGDKFDVFEGGKRANFFPEFELFFDGGFLFLAPHDFDGFQIRQTVLAFCIAMTEN